MLKILTLVLGLVTVLFAGALPTQSIVKISVTSSIPNYQYPWESGKIENSSGTGIIINDKTILTSAHVVQNAKFIYVRTINNPKKYRAYVIYISHQADLAILSLPDKTFFEKTKPLKFTTSAKSGDTITVLGFPIGGDGLSTTKGIISRIERNIYAQSAETMLLFQVDAAINPGNSGGAAINQNGEVVGVVMQGLVKANNIGYLVPSLIINTFLQDIKDARVDGFDNSETRIQSLSNDTLKEYYGITHHQGVIVSHLDKNEKQLKLGDLILSIDNHPVSHEGTVETPYGMMSYKHLLQTKPIGETLSFKIIRDSKPLTINYILKKKYEMVRTLKGMEPRYLVYGGLVFSPLTHNYLKAINLESSNFELFFFDNCRTKHIIEPVILQYEVLEHSINSGYVTHGDVVKSVNGVLVEDFAHFVKLIDSVDTPYAVIEFIDEDFKKIILDTQKAKESFKDIKAIYGLSTDRSFY